MCIGSSFRFWDESKDETGVLSLEYSETKVADKSLESRPFLLNTDSMFLNDRLIGDLPVPFFSRLSGVVRVGGLEHAEFELDLTDAAGDESVSYFPISSLVVPLRVEGALPETRSTGNEKYGP